MHKSGVCVKLVFRTVVIGEMTICLLYRLDHLVLIIDLNLELDS